MMRAARFVSQLGFDVEPATLAAISNMADRIDDRLGGTSARRAVQALDGQPIVGDGLRVLVDSGLAEHVVPELPALRLEIDEHHHHKDVFEHTLTVVEQAARPRDGRRRRGARSRPRPAARRAASRHWQARDPVVHRRRPCDLPPPRGRGRVDDQGAVDQTARPPGGRPRGSAAARRRGRGRAGRGASARRAQAATR